VRHRPRTMVLLTSAYRVTLFANERGTSCPGISVDASLSQGMSESACCAYHKGCYNQLQGSMLLCDCQYQYSSTMHQNEVKKANSNPRPPTPRAKNWLPDASRSYYVACLGVCWGEEGIRTTGPYCFFLIPLRPMVSQESTLYTLDCRPSLVGVRSVPAMSATT